MLTPVRLTFLRSLLVDSSPKVASESANFFASQYGIGVNMGRSFEYSSSDVSRAQELLLALGQLTEQPTRKGDRAGARNRPGITEKSGATSPHADSVAFQLLGGFRSANSTCCVGYSVGTAAEVMGIVPDALLVVENFEAFRQINRYAWVQAHVVQLRVLCLYRGDTTYKIEDAAQVIAANEKPAWGFFDFDPAGLGMCSQLKNLQHVMLPPAEILVGMARDKQMHHLFHNQIVQWQGILDKATHHEIRSYWASLQKVRCGLPQEWLRDITSSLE